MDTESRLNTIKAARHLGVSPQTLRTSRTTGVLCGVKAPAYRKLTRHVVYDRATLDAWLDQFPEQTHSAATA